MILILALTSTTNRSSASLQNAASWGREQLPPQAYRALYYIIYYILYIINYVLCIAYYVLYIIYGVAKAMDYIWCSSRRRLTGRRLAYEPKVMNLYVCVYVSLSIYIYIYIYKYTCIYIYIYTHIHI